VSSRSPWVRITLRGHEKDSWAELNIPASEVVSGLAKHTETNGYFVLEDFYANGDGVKVTIEKIPKAVP
jgi:hypothetical protein